MAIAMTSAGCVASSGTSGATGSRGELATEPGAASSLPAAVLDPILGDASTRTGAPRASLEILTAESRTWPDGSLGCPQPGMAYTQAVVDGYRVIVRAGSRTLDYRGSGPGRFLLCELARPG